jgi:AcrR family transcriptional regulator
VTAARQALLEKAMAHVAEHGLSDLSLRELAAGIGTSHRMLLYHFGSREGLVAAIVAAMEDQQRSALEDLASRARSPREVVEAQWLELCQPDVRPFVALFFEVLALAVHGRPGTEGFLAQLTEPWLAQAGRLAGSLGADADPVELRLGVAVVRGLLVEVLATGDTAGATASLRRFLDLWETGSQSGRV